MGAGRSGQPLQLVAQAAKRYLHMCRAFVAGTGGIMSEQVALAIDPYPRKPDASFGDRIESTDKDDIRPNPFAVLKDWKKD